MPLPSVEHIMRDVNYGWLIRYIHAKWSIHVFYCSLFTYFPVVFFIAHIQSLENYYGTLVLPILFLMIATAFMGYVLPWGQMSFWGAYCYY